MLAEKPASIRAVSISRGFQPNSPEDRDYCLTLAQRLADEYGLDVGIETRGYFATCRFTRRAGDVRPDGAQSANGVAHASDWEPSAPISVAGWHLPRFLRLGKMHS
jgi:hypothetical protein